MIWFPENKVVFLHVPKTGGTSMKIALQSNEEKSEVSLTVNDQIHFAHLTLEQIKTWRPELWSFLGAQSTFSFAVVRHPLMRSISAYKWFLKTHQYPMSFEDYLTTGHRLYRWDRRFVHLTPQSRFTHLNGQKGISAVLRFEEMRKWEAILRPHLEVRGLQFPKMPHHNTSEDVKVTIDRKKAKSLVAELYREDFESHGYDPSLE